MLMDAITTYLNTPSPGRALLVSIPAGAGKTTAGVQIAEQVAASGHRVLYAGPRKEFFDDIQALYTRPSWWYAWRSREYVGDPNNQLADPEMCRWHAQMKKWLDRGYEAIPFCLNNRICGGHYLNNACLYQAQQRRNENIIYGHHAHVTLGHPLMKQFNLIIGDELPLSSFLHKWLIPISDILPPDVEDEELATLLRNLKWLCVQTPDPGQQWQGADLYQVLLPGGPQAVLDLCERYKLIVGAKAKSPDLRTAASADEAPYFHLPNLIALLSREARRLIAGLPIIGRVRCTPDGLTLFLRHTPHELPSHIIWFDATGNEHIYAALLGRPVEVVRFDVAMAGTVYQMWYSSNNRRAVLDERPDKAGKPQGENKQDHLRAQIARIMALRNYQRPAIISYKVLGDSLLPGADQSHFGGNRGTNRLQDCDALFVVGSPLPPLVEIKEIASMVYFERDEPWRDSWHALDVPFVGQGAAYSVGGFWDDTDLRSLLEQLREAELVQAAHRARPLRRKVDVWLLTNVVTELPVELVSLHQLFDALDSEGKPLTGIDIVRWADVLALPATEDDPITTARLMIAFDITRPTAIKWFDALKATGRYTVSELAPTSTRSRPTQSLVKSFDVPSK